MILVLIFVILMTAWDNSCLAADIFIVLCYVSIILVGGDYTYQCGRNHHPNHSLSGLVARVWEVLAVPLACRYVSQQPGPGQNPEPKEMGQLIQKI